MKITTIYGAPGCGKTHTLIDIIEREVNNGVHLGDIAFVAFSRKAAYEAQDRIRSHFLCSDIDVRNVRTIHSMTFRATRANAQQMMSPAKYRDFGLKSGFSLKGYYSVDEGFTSKDDDFIGIEQLYRNNRKACEKVLYTIDHARFVTYMKMYRKYKDTFRYLDFTDLLDLYLQDDHQENVKVAIIDEAQDLSDLQWKVVMKAFRGVDRLYVAGDDDQAVYTYAGASIETFISLKGEPRVLEHSFRLPPLLIYKAKQITNMISPRVDKKYHGDNDKQGSYKYVSDLRSVTFNDSESYYILARNNFSLGTYIDYCIDNGLRFSLKGKDFLSTTDIKEIKSGKDLDWDLGKIAYVNKLIGKGTLDNKPNINIGTIHSVKGGEADNVIVSTDISRGVQKQLEIDESSEHRCFYVAITRARKNVVILSPTSKYNYPYLR